MSKQHEQDKAALIAAIGYDPVPLSIRDHPEITFEYRTAKDRDGLIERILAAGFTQRPAQLTPDDATWRKTVPDNVAFGPDIEPDQREFGPVGHVDPAIPDGIIIAALNTYSWEKVRDRYDADLLMAGFMDGALWQRQQEES